MTASDVVVVGGGIAGLRTIERLRGDSFAGSITMVGAEAHLPYDRPPLTKQVLRGERDLPALRDEYDTLGVETALGRTAAALDIGSKTITLSDGTRLGYTSLVLATGARPRLLPALAPRPGLHVLRTFDDALALREAVRARGAITIVGGGFIGCEVAASARMMGARATIVEALPAPLIRVAGKAASDEIVALHEGHGVEIISGLAVADVLGETRVSGLRLADGREVPAEDVLLALGVVPDLDWLTGSGVQLEDGVVCDAGGRTSAPDVYAVGDVARWWHPLADGHRRVEHWTSAVDQAAVVAANIVSAPGEPVSELVEVPYFWSDQYDVKIQALGFIDAEADTDVLHTGERTVVVYSRDGLVTGVLGFSAARAVMRTRALIAERARLGKVVDLLTTR